MKLLKILVVMFLLSLSSEALARDFDWIKDLNIQAQADPSPCMWRGFRWSIATLVGGHLFLLKRIGVSAPPFRLEDTTNRWRGGAFRHESHPGGIPFFPNYLLQDLTSIAVYLACFMAVVFFDPYLFFPKEAFSPANPYLTPARIKPEWYFLPNYQTLRSFRASSSACRCRGWP